MLRLFSAFVLIVSALAGRASALDQPATTPHSDRYRIAEQKLPPLEWVTARKPKPYPVYGIYTWFGEYRQLREQVKQVGWSTLRIGGPTTDENMKILFEEGLNFTLVIGDRSVSRRDDYASDAAYIQARLEDAEAFLDRFGAEGSFYDDYPQYKGRYIPFMQLHNEPNFHYMYRHGSEAEREALYAELMPQLTSLIKRRSPRTQVIGFSTGGAGAGDLRFVQRVLAIEPRCLTEVDVFSTHPYVHPVPPETNKVERWGSYSIANSLHQLRRTFAEHGREDITVWYTEGGWPLRKADGGAYANPTAAVPAHFQAAYAVRYYALALRLGVDCVTTMFITDTDGHAGGFFDRLRDMAWRPSARAVQTMIRLMPHPRLVGAQADGDDQDFIYAFKSHAHQPDSPVVIMAWRIEGFRTVDIEVPYARARVTDMLGGAREVAAVNGVVTVEIGPLPIYIQSASRR